MTMVTITEDFVSFETAKLLKEKNCPDFGYSCIYDSEGNKAQTQSIIMKWLREVHKLFIMVDCGVGAYVWSIADISNGNVILKVDAIASSYEQAVEAAIKYCLDLI